MRKSHTQITLFIAIATLAMSSACAAAADSGESIPEDETISVTLGINLIINGMPFQAIDSEGSEAEAFVFGDTAYAPIRTISELFGTDVVWDADEKTVHLNSDAHGYEHNVSTVYQKLSIETELDVNSEVAIMLNGFAFVPRDEQGEEVQVFYHKGTAYLPLRAVSGIFGVEINWVEEVNTVFLGNYNPVAGFQFQGESEDTPRFRSHLEVQAGDKLPVIEIISEFGERIMTDNLPGDADKLILYLWEECPYCMANYDRYAEIIRDYDSDELTVLLIWTTEIPYRDIDAHGIPRGKSYTQIESLYRITRWVPTHFIIDSENTIVYIGNDTEGLDEILAERYA